jgi:predicted oxidoreductase (fatty acid repression mutant protein)
MPRSSVDVALDFVSRINDHDVGGILELMADNHRFVDGLGQEVQGKEGMKKGWEEYFAWFPDYKMTIERSFSTKQWVALFGRGSGTFAEPSKYRSKENLHWNIPAAWQARVVDGLLVEWQVYVDNEPVWKSMGVKRY